MPGAGLGGGAKWVQNCAHVCAIRDSNSCSRANSNPFSASTVPIIYCLSTLVRKEKEKIFIHIRQSYRPRLLMAVIR